jgi:hypothetical protein
MEPHFERRLPDTQHFGRLRGAQAFYISKNEGRPQTVR